MPVAFTPEAIEARRALIRTQYPTAHLPTLAKQLGISVNRLQNLASRLGVRRAPEAIVSTRRSTAKVLPRSADIRNLLTSLARRANGVRSGDVARALDASPSTVWGMVAAMQREGQLHPAAISHRNVRYFATAEAAADFLRRLASSGRRSAEPTAQPVVIKRGQGPAYLPGEPQRTERTKVTIAPPPKAALRSNTYLFSA